MVIKMNKKFIMIVLLLIIVKYPFAQEKCTVIGYVKHRFSGIVLKGVRIKIGGTSLETETNEMGRYEFQNLEPGTYSFTAHHDDFLIQTQMITLKAEDVKALNFVLIPIESEDEITGPFIQNPFKAAIPLASIKMFSLKDREKLPARGGLSLLEFVPGITHIGREGTYSIRGSRTDEIGYFIDGMPVRSFEGGGSSFMLNHNAIDRVEIQRGWFDAKYGRIIGGIVNLVPKYGGEKYSGNLSGITEALTGSWIGARNYSYKLYEGYVGGPLYKLPKGRFFVSYEGRNMLDRTPSPTSTRIYPDGRLPNNGEDFYSFFGHASYLIGENMELELGGARNSKKFNTYNLRFRFDTDHFLHRENTESFYYGKFSHRLNDKTFYTVKLNRTLETGKYEDNMARDDILEYYREINNPYDDMRLFYDPSLDDEGLISVNSWSKWENSYLSFKVDLTHQLTKRHRIEAGADYQKHFLRSYTMTGLRNAYKNPNHFSIEEITAYGYDWPRDENNDYLTPDTYEDYIDYTYYHWDPNDPLFIGMENRIKKVNSGVKAPKRPLNFSLYLQDKIEYEDVFINIGLRYDRFDPASPVIEDYDQPVDPETNELKLGDKIISNRFSPRLGIGFQASAKTYLHANYGIFYQFPVYDLTVIPYDTFKDRALRGSIASRSNPGLKPEQLSAYELGINQYLYKNVWMNFTIFYKNFKDMVLLERKESLFGYFAQYLNGDVATARGYEFSLYLKKHRNFDFFFNYSLMYAYGTGSNPDSNNRNVWIGTPVLDHPERLDFDRRHKITGNFGYYLNFGEGPVLLGKKVLQEAGFTVLLKAGSGMPYQPARQPLNEVSLQSGAPNPAGPKNSQDGPWIFSMDLKASKTIRLKDRMKLKFFVWAINLTDRRNSETVFKTTGKVDYNGWFETEEGKRWLELYGKDGEVYTNTARYGSRFRERYPEGGEKYYKDVLLDPMKYFFPRIIRFGLEIEF